MASRHAAWLMAEPATRHRPYAQTNRPCMLGEQDVLSMLRQREGHNPDLWGRLKR
jgi:hypothetical protein